MGNFENEQDIPLDDTSFEVLLWNSKLLIFQVNSHRGRSIDQEPVLKYLLYMNCLLTFMFRQDHILLAQKTAIQVTIR